MNHYIYPLLLVINSEFVFHTEHTFATKTSALLPNCNRVGNIGTIDTIDIENIKNFFQEIPFGWFVDSTDSNAIMLLEEDGSYKKKVDHPAMHISLAGIKPLDHHDIHIKRITSDAQLLVWIDIVVKSFEIALPEEYRTYIQYLTQHADNDTLFFYMAYYQDVPVATSMIIKRDTIAALHWIGTLPGYRHKGIGHAITHATLVAAEQSGCTDAVLFTSKLGKSVYERVGFTEYALYHIYVF